MTGNTGDTGDTGDTGNSGNAGITGEFGGGWFIEDRSDFPFVTADDPLGQPLASKILALGSFGERNWTAQWWAFLVLHDFALSGWHTPVDLAMNTAWGLVPTSTAAIAAELALLVNAHRDERAAALGEIISQASEHVTDFMAVLTMTPGSHPNTYRVLHIASQVASYAVLFYKGYRERPRPSQLLPALLPPIPVPGHASWPSGHATQAWLMARCIEYVLTGRLTGTTISGTSPGTVAGSGDLGAISSNLRTLALRIARNREIAGLHYPSDSAAGVTLADAIFPYLTAMVTGATPPRDLVRKGRRIGEGGVAVMMEQGYYDQQSIRDDIDERIEFFDTPPEYLDPPRMYQDPDVDLWQYGIPPRPDEVRFRALADFWDEMFAYPLDLTEPTYTLPSMQALISAHLFLTSGGRRESSSNWSGTYITPRDGQQITEVYGRWRVPTVNLPGSVGAGTECHSSVWIGLDGARRYFNSTLPQIGSGQDVNQPSSDPPYYLWWQWWMRDNPMTYTPAILPVLVGPNHRILANLQVLDETHVHFTIKNQTTGKSYPPFKLKSPKQVGTGRRAKVSGATAEWIVERPAAPATGPYPLPAYGQVSLTDCYAIQALLPSGGTPGLGIERTLEGARLISMYQITGNRRVPLSKPERSVRPDVDTFNVNYVGP